MKPTRTIRRLTSVLAVLASAVLASLAAAPTAFASTSPGPAEPALGQLPPLPAGWDKHPPLPGPAGVHVALVGGMPGWQITLIAAAAAILAAAAVLLARARAARRHVTATAA